MSARGELKLSRRWVVKIGSALLTDNGVGLDYAAIASWVKQLVALRNQGVEVVLVSSGAVAAGMTRLGLKKRPETIHELQAAAAVGQMGLVQTWESEFQRYGVKTAQVLLTHDDLSNRERYLNARSALRALLDLDVVPVINENDTVVTDEIRFGDNDTLAALVANLVEADVSAILTDQKGLFDSDPRSNPDAKLIPEAMAMDKSLDAVAGGSVGGLGRGGMVTKIRSARLAARSGAHTLIAWGREPEVLTRLRDGESVGTCLQADQRPVAARKQWLAGHLQFKGALTLDDGAVAVLAEQGKSLLPIGVRAVDGSFHRGDLVRCLNGHGQEVARGLVGYSADEARKIAGQPSSEIQALLGYVDGEELIHRDNLVITL
ncbi:glutamate 5-kinase [Porticoccaceae bacterium LTM1]|nr:glutamate 5-kinase [Porticoccaceae bacterium LTM1]